MKMMKCCGGVQTKPLIKPLKAGLTQSETTAAHLPELETAQIAGEVTDYKTKCSAVAKSLNKHREVEENHNKKLSWRADLPQHKNKWEIVEHLHLKTTMVMKRR